MLIMTQDTVNIKQPSLYHLSPHCLMVRASHWQSGYEFDSSQELEEQSHLGTVDVDGWVSKWIKCEWVGG